MTGSLHHLSARGRSSNSVVFGVLSIAVGAYALQQVLVLPVLPQLQNDLHTSQAWVVWVLSGFTLTSVILTPTVGKLGDRFGKELALQFVLLMLVVGCIGAVFAWNIWSLIVCRMLQGGAAATFPLAFAILRDEFPPAKVGGAVGAIAAVVAMAAGIGLVVSGPITDAIGWRYLFVLNAGVTLMAMALVWRFVPPSPLRTTSRIDIPGAVLLGAFLGAIMIALTQGAAWGWLSAETLGLFAAGFGMFVVWWQVELRREEPLIDIRTMRDRTLLVTNIASIGVGMATFGPWVLVPLFMQHPYGLSSHLAELTPYGFGVGATKTGLYMIPSSLIALVSGPMVGRFERRLGAKWLASIGLMICATASALLAVRHEHPWQVVAWTTVLGFGAPIALAATATLVMRQAPDHETAVASGVNTVFRNIGVAIGAQFGAALLATRTLPGTQVATESAFTAAFASMAGAGVFFALIMLLASPRAARRTAEATLAAEETT